MPELIKSLDRPPYLRVWRNFFDEDEVVHLRSIAEGRFYRSGVMNASGNGTVIDNVRTSDGAWLNRQETATYLQRIADNTGTPLANWETPQVLRYGVGGEYRPHSDWLYPEHPSSVEALSRGGQRMGSFLAGLGAAEEGGETIFPDIGESVKLDRGDALFFWYPDPSPASLSLHGSSPVVRGTKYVMPAWYRANEFDSPWRKLRVLDNVINQEDCRRLIDYYRASPNKEGGCDRVVRFDSVEAQAFIRPFVEHVARRMRQQYGGGEFIYDTAVLACMGDGFVMENHADNVKYDGTPNHTPHRTHTAVLMLNDGEGGATVYGDNPQTTKYEKRITQKAGRMHMSIAGPDTFHRVERVIGERFTLPVWFKGQH